MDIAISSRVPMELAERLREYSVNSGPSVREVLKEVVGGKALERADEEPES
ncbi:MAG: hypothetical protein QXJ48_02815 [Candidatus Korarchaeum sp.]